MMLDQQPQVVFSPPHPCLAFDLLPGGGMLLPAGSQLSPGWWSSRSSTVTNELFAACCLPRW